MRTLCLLLCVCALGTAQTRSVTDNVYSAGQAGGGQDIHQSQCSSCHGKALDGGGGPPLVGDGFLSSWSERPLTNVVDKIQKTMPFNKPGSLSRQQSIDHRGICQKGRPVPMDRTDWKKYVSDLVEVGKLAHRASQAGNADAFIDISEKLNDACANCYKVYPTRAAPKGSGATRCQPPAEEK